MKEYLSYFLPFVFVAPLFKLTRLEKNKGGGYVSKETMVLRRWGWGGWVYQDNLVFSAELIIKIDHREFLKLMFRALSLPSDDSQFTLSTHLLKPNYLLERAMQCAAMYVHFE